MAHEKYDAPIRLPQYCCPVFARCCPKIPFFRPAVDTRQGLISVVGTGKWGDCHMMIKASGRSALIIATGLFVYFAGPTPIAATSAAVAATSKPDSATSEKSVRQSTRRWKRYSRRSGKIASKPAETKKAVEQDVALTDGALAIPATVANANAQLASAEPVPGSAQAMTAKANILLAAADKPGEGQPTSDAVLSSDQLNDVDRALQQNPAKQTVAMASAKTASPAAPVLASSNDSSTWDQTSLIGKIFIAFGALLTMASAARMFMA
jgi:hypothetical protein